MAGQMPGISALSQTTEKVVWFGREESQLFVGPNMIGAAAVDAGNTPTTTLRAGLIMGRKTSDSLWYQWNPDGTDGTEVPGAVLLGPDINMLDANGSVENKGGIMMLMQGGLKVADLLIEGTAFTSSSSEQLARRLMAKRFVFNDDLQGKFAISERTRREIAKTADYTVTEADNGTLFTNTGAGGAVIFTLPALQAGLVYEFLVVADQTVTVASAAGDDIVAFNDASADSLAFSTGGQKIGGHLVLRTNAAGTKWYVDNLSPGNTITVAT